ncbi:ligase-associated DNA damage response DEXH box helicase [Ottowia thiooxydans]|uniref:ligase-associated DNA damage response DEXH box helicase n=1 Tax=Ottowia thiooxydans TaxID=219182 RepID=UPI00041E4590|nr:ligase-associated DNA damage response DEXH box helicase [Ottowia thiooxydans]
MPASIQRAVPRRRQDMVAARRAWRTWLSTQGISAARFQQQAWDAHARGQSGLISAPTGSGKTLAALGGPIIAAMASGAQEEKKEPGFRMLWITPLRALASDTRERITKPVQDLLPAWRVALRTGDASAKDKRLSQTGGAQLLITTPESLAILLSHERSVEQFSGVQSVVVDEWHELLPSKRGVLLQLNLARLRVLAPEMQIWGLSATIGNLDQALQVLVRERSEAQMVIIEDTRPKPFHLHSILPAANMRLPWAGHLGLANLGEVAKLVLSTSTSIIFTNTRSQAELWFTALSSIWPEHADTLAVHHSSLDHHVRQGVEDGLRSGQLRCVVATSSLDLGVDFPAVDRVIQIGGARSVARTVQRAGRAKHRPGAAIHIDGVATQAMDLCEFAATRELAQQRVYESRTPLTLCFDVLSQHVMSMALSGGFEAEALMEEVKSSAAFEAMTMEQWNAVIDFLTRGSNSLVAYPQYERLKLGTEGRYAAANQVVTRRHRMGIGTIVTQSAISVRYLRGTRLGSIEENFIARLQPGDVFNFAGRSLQFVRVEGTTAWVRRSASIGTHTPAWAGSLMAMSLRVGERMQGLMAQTVRDGDDANHRIQTPELRHLLPLIQLQQQRSRVPQETQLLIEHVGGGQSKASARRSAAKVPGLFVYPFAGRVVHEGLALLLATRLATLGSNTFFWTCNEIGFMLQPQLPIDESSFNWTELLSPQGLQTDLQEAVNFSELARKRFKEIAQIAGLVTARIPGSRVPNRQLQVSAGLLFDVLSKYDPDHILLLEARQEALNQELHLPTLREILGRITQLERVQTWPQKHTPFSFGLWAESFRGQISNETWTEKVKRAAAQMEDDAAPASQGKNMISRRKAA